MNRRTFLTALSALPLVGPLFASKAVAVPLHAPGWIPERFIPEGYVRVASKWMRGRGGIVREIYRLPCGLFASREYRHHFNREWEFCGEVRG